MRKLILGGLLGALITICLWAQVPDISSFSYTKILPDLTKFVYTKSLSDFMFDIATDIIPGYLHEHKFGRNPDVDAAEDIWDYGGTYTFLTSAATLYASSSETADTQVIQVYGLDADWALQDTTVTLSGRSQVKIGTGVTWMRMFRAKNIGTTDLTGDVYIAKTDTLTAGVPNTASKIKAMIISPNNNTLMAIYTIPAGYTGYLLTFYSSMNRRTTTGSADIAFYVKPFGQVFQLADFASLVGGGTSFLNRPFMIPKDMVAKSDIKMRVTPSANDTDVSAGFDVILVPN